MYRILSASKDGYITNKYIAGSRSLDANVGQAGTLDLYKLYNETVVISGGSPVPSVTEVTRLLIQFDYGKIEALTGSVLDYSSGNFAAAIKLKDIYGGQTVPSNFTVELLPLSKSFNEGRGYDVIAYRDIDAANWVTASLSPVVTWSQPGAGAVGVLGDDIDVIASGNVGSGLQDLRIVQTFARGDEDLSMDVTTIVSATLAGILPNNGFRISFIDSEETDSTTRFVKRFGSRHTFNKDLHPELVVTYDDVIADPGPRPFFDMSQSLYTYNSIRGTHRNYFSGSTEITGANSLAMELAASKSVSSTVSVWSPSHSASINIITRSLTYFSRSYSGSQFTFGALAQTGIYSAPFHLSTTEDAELGAFVSNAKEIPFKVMWKSIDGTVNYAQNYVTLRKIEGFAVNALEMNLVVNITNLKDEYNSNETQRLRVFAADYNQEVPGYKLPLNLDSVILSDLRWRLIKAWTREIVVPWSTSTRMSTDAEGMYFDMYFNDLDINEVYEFELLCSTGIGRDITITNSGFRFKVLV